jgi:hypothetical protein
VAPVAAGWEKREGASKTPEACKELDDDAICERINWLAVTGGLSDYINEPS